MQERAVVGGVEVEPDAQPFLGAGGDANDWSRDQRWVVFTERRRDDQQDLYLLDADVMPSGAEWIGGYWKYDIHPDGDRFLVLLEPELESVGLVVVENWLEELERLVPPG